MPPIRVFMALPQVIMKEALDRAVVIAKRDGDPPKDAEPETPDPTPDKERA